MRQLWIAFPLMYRNARAAFEQVDVNLIYAARTLGMSEFSIFWKVIIPAAVPGVASGTILTFARALGEYGATSILGEHSRKDRYNLTKNSDGYAGRRLCHCRSLGRDCNVDCVWDNRTYESDNRKASQTDKTVVIWE